MATTAGRNRWAWATSRSTERLAPQATTSKRSGGAGGHVEGLGADRTGGSDHADRGDAAVGSRGSTLRPGGHDGIGGRGGHGGHLSSLPEDQPIFRARTR